MPAEGDQGAQKVWRRGLAPPHWRPLPRKPHALDLLPDEGGSSADSRAASQSQLDWGSQLQGLFERELGPPLKPLPDVQRASSSSRGADSRQRNKLRFNVAAGQPLDYQAVPWAGTVLGLTHHPAKTPLPRKPGDRPATQPATAVLWGLVQPADHVGVTTSLSAVDKGPTGFGGWEQQGFLDVTRRAGVDYCVRRHPATGLSGDVEVSATSPKLPLLPELTLRHRVAGTQVDRRLQHSSAVSARLLRGAAVARVELVEPAPGSALSPADGAVLRMELVGRSKASRGLAGGVKVKPELAGSFKTAGSSSGNSGGGDGGSSSDDEGGSSGSGSRVGGAAPDRQRQRVPGVRLEVAPSTARTWEDVSGRWQQAWGSRLRSTVGYQARQRQWALDATHKLSGWLSVAGSLASSVPDDWQCLAPAPEAAAGANGGASGSIDSSMAQRLRQLNSHMRSYAAAAQLCRAKVKLVCRLKQPARHLAVESCMEGDGPRHALSCRLGRRPDHAQQHGWCDVALEARPRARDLQLHLRLDCFVPL